MEYFDYHCLEVIRCRYSIGECVVTRRSHLFGLFNALRIRGRRARTGFFVFCWAATSCVRGARLGCCLNSIFVVASRMMNLIWVQTAVYTITTSHRQSEEFKPRSVIAWLYSLEVLQDPDHCIRSFCQCKVLACKDEFH